MSLLSQANDTPTTSSTIRLEIPAPLGRRRCQIPRVTKLSLLSSKLFIHT